MRICILSIALLIATSVSPAWADVFLLKNGGKVTGDLLEPAAASPDFYLVAISAGGKIKLAKDQVESVLAKTEEERRYEAMLPKVENSVAAHFTMALWCHDKGLVKQRQFHLEQVIRIDPEHENARHGLGYSKVKGRWIRPDEWQKKQGYVFYKGDWRSRQEIMLDQARSKVEVAEAEWQKQLRVWQRWLDKKRHDDAVDKIKAIEDRAAAGPIADLLKREDRIHVKLVYIEALGRLSTHKGNEILMEMAIEDESRRIRNECMEQLENQGTVAAVGHFLRVLQRSQGASLKNNVKLNRAGIALGRMGNKEAIQPLIEALVTEHIVSGGNSATQGLGRLGVGFGNAGGGGGTFQAGGNSKPTKRKFNNEEVLYGLKELTGQDFRFDQEGWKKWLIQSRTPRDVNLRRDD